MAKFLAVLDVVLANGDRGVTNVDASAPYELLTIEDIRSIEQSARVKNGWRSVVLVNLIPLED